jgi:hypothetical protein
MPVPDHRSIRADEEADGIRLDLVFVTGDSLFVVNDDERKLLVPDVGFDGLETVDASVIEVDDPQVGVLRMPPDQVGGEGLAALSGNEAEFQPDDLAL